jgi:hypothetical protein
LIEDQSLRSLIKKTDARSTNNRSSKRFQKRNSWRD